jgi:hypothetical protein
MYSDLLVKHVNVLGIATHIAQIIADFARSDIAMRPIVGVVHLGAALIHVAAHRRRLLLPTALVPLYLRGFV